MILQKVIYAIMLMLAPMAMLTAQDREAGIFIGAANYQGDLVQPHVKFQETRTAFGIIGRKYINPRISVRGNLMYAKVSGSDEYMGDPADLSNPDRFRARRNLHFRSNIYELSAVGEFNILPYISNSERYRIAPYVFAGAGLYYFNPQAELNGEWHNLQPLGTEGQTISDDDDMKPYSRLQGNVPYGVGLKFSLGNFWNVGVHAGQRLLFTDYLDDVSTNYPENLEAIPTELGQELSWRGDELQNYNAKFDGGNKRGTKDVDLYVFTGVSITKTFRGFPCVDF